MITRALLVVGLLMLVALTRWPTWRAREANVAPRPPQSAPLRKACDHGWAASVGDHGWAASVGRVEHSQQCAQDNAIAVNMPRQ